MIKDEIKKWFESDRKYETGRALYFKYSHNFAFKTILNRQGNNPSNYNRLCYELAKIAGIPEPLYKRILSTPITKAKAEETPVMLDINTLDPKVILENLELYNLSGLKWPVLQKVYRASTHEGAKTKADILSAFDEMKQKKLHSIVPENVKKAIRLRQEFPFLYSKDCPDTLKILVADMITAHDQYVQDHAKLMDTLDENSLAALSQSVVENYLENRQIWDELQHYKQHKSILGKHPIFEWLTRQQEIRKMDVPGLVKLMKQLENNIPRTLQKITEEPDHANTEQRRQRVEWFRKELAEVKKLLNINE